MTCASTTARFRRRRSRRCTGSLGNSRPLKAPQFLDGAPCVCVHGEANAFSSLTSVHCSGLINSHLLPEPWRPLDAMKTFFLPALVSTGLSFLGSISAEAALLYE